MRKTSNLSMMARPDDEAKRNRLSVVWPWGLMAALLLAAVVASGVYRRQTAAALGPMVLTPVTGIRGGQDPSSRPATTREAAPNVLRFGTFNMASGVGLDGRRDLDRTARTLEQCDVVGLNETSAGLAGGDQPSLLAKMLAAGGGRPWAGWFAPAEIRWWHPHFGNGLLTRVPLYRPMWLPMPSTQERGRRNVVWAVVPMGDIQVNLLLTHIDRQADQMAQLIMIREMFARVANPAVLMGDFNVGIDHPELQALMAQPGVIHSGSGFPGAGEATRVEHIFVKGLDVVGAGVVDLKASDHPMVWADLAVPVKAAKH
jgi:endonuclease/exonuclease/phosphatase family metal-dependent hydrolase